MAQPPGFSFEYDQSAADFAVSKLTYLAARSGISFQYIATSVLVLVNDDATPSAPRLLLLQRSAHDEDPNKWEPPGGACDDEDISILHAAARELREEAGLEAARISGPVGEPYFFDLDNGGTVCRFTFAAHVKSHDGGLPTVTLNPEEHQRYIWATEAEVKAKRVGEFELAFTMAEAEQAVLQAFAHFAGLQS